MELRFLRYFVTVAEEQNVTRAAARLHVSQPPLSRQIKALEEELGIQLFDRTANRLRLTEAGYVFLEEAYAVLARADEALQTARSLAGEDQGSLSVGFSPTLTMGLIPDALRKLRRTRPGVRAHLHDLSTGEMLEGLRQQSLQVGLMMRMDKALLKGLTLKVIARHEVLLGVGPSHRLATMRSVSLERIRREPVLGYSHAQYPEFRQWLKQLFQPAGEAPRIAEEYEGFASLVAAVEAGFGVALLHSNVGMTAGTRLKLIPIVPKPPHLEVIAVRNEKDKGGLGAAFFDLVGKPRD